MGVSFTIGDYTYEQDYDTPSGSNDISVRVRDNNHDKVVYEDIPSTITYNDVTYNVVNLCVVYSSTDHDTLGCFEGCENMVIPPNIPNNIRNMFTAFYRCSALTTAPVISSTVTDMTECFFACDSLVGDIYVYATDAQVTNCFEGDDLASNTIVLHAMNANSSLCDALAQTSASNRVYVDVSPEAPISFIDTQMNYVTNEGLKQLSLQTNADLVQCEVPNLANGGTITTNVNDALIDLYNRGAQYNESNGYYFSSGAGRIKISGSPDEIQRGIISSSTAKPIPVWTPQYLESGTEYTFTGGYRGSSFATYIVLYGTEVRGGVQYNVTGIVSSRVFPMTSGWSKVWSGNMAYGYKDITFITPNNINDLRAVLCYCPYKKADINIDIEPRIIKVGGE